MGNYTARQRDGLPRWAQRELDRLERDNEGLRARLTTGPEGSRVIAEPLTTAAVPLGNATVRFTLSDPPDLDDPHARYVEIEIDAADGVVRLTSAHTLLIQPTTANSATVRPVTRAMLTRLTGGHDPFRSA